SGVIAGTPQYMAPEQARGEPLDARSDLFSLGSVLYALCTGQPPFRADHSLAVLKRICEDTPRPVREADPALPPWLGDLIARLHAKDPADRFQSAAEVAELLGRYLAALQKPDAAPPTLAWRAAPAAAPRSRRGPWWGAAAGLLVAVAGAGAVYSPAIYRFATGQGQVVIETDDPDVEVVVKQDGETATIVDKKTGRTV